MAIRRPSKPNKDDFMSNAMDKRLEDLEEEISAIYTLAAEDATENLDNYLTAFEKAKEKMYARYIEGEISEQEYREWLENMIVRREEYQAMISSITDILTNADIAAMALVEGELPYVIAQSYDFGQFVGSLMADREGMDHVSFRIYNADSVQAIIRDNPDLIPMVDVPVDQAWNRTHLRRELTASIINGDSIPDVARRLMRITSMDQNAAIRNARTAMTAGENLGRNESYNRIRSQGIEMVKEWSATYDSRTRDTHRLLNGTRANEKGLFGEGILDSLGEPLMEFPGDPKGAAAEIYNCRCRLNIVPPNYSREANAQAYERWMQENYPADYRALNEDNYFDRLHKTDEWTTEAQQRVDRRIERLRQNNASKGYADANDLERAIMADGGSLTDPRLLAYSNTLEEESKYNASLKNNLEQAIQENGYTEGIRNAIEAEERDAQNYLDNLPELKTPEQIATAEAMQERLRILAALKPSQEAAITEIAPIAVTRTDSLPSSVRERYDAFAHRYAQGKVEHSMLVRSNGEILFESSSRRRDNAPFAPSYSFAESLPADTYSIHNHPANEIFSWRDIQNYELYGVSGTITTPDGWEFTLFNGNSPRWNLSQTEREEAEWLSGAFMRAREEISDNWTTSRRAYMDSIADLSREEQRELVRAWDSNHSTYEESIAWLEAHAEEYGFIFRRRRIT